MTAISRCWLILLAALSVACAPLSAKHDALSQQEKEALQGRPVVFVRRLLPAFEFYSSLDMALQLVGGSFGLAALWASTGAVLAAGPSRSTAFLAEYQLTDPAYGVAAVLGRSLSPRYGLVFAGISNDVVENYDEQEISQSLKGRANFALDLRTAYWG